MKAIERDTPLNAQRAILAGTSFSRQEARIRAIAAALAIKPNIPGIQEQLTLIEQVDTDKWWEQADQAAVENMRIRLCGLVIHVDKNQRDPIFTNFEDELGDSIEVDIIGGPSAYGDAHFSRFRQKAAAFLRENSAEAVVAKFRSGEPITDADIADLKRVLVAEEIGTIDNFETASKRVGNFSRFIRSLVGLDQAAAQKAFGKFLDNKRYGKNQIVFVKMIIEALTTTGQVEAEQIYGQPYVAVAPTGPEAIFAQGEVDEIFVLINDLSSVGLDQAN